MTERQRLKQKKRETDRDRQEREREREGGGGGRQTNTDRQTDRQRHRQRETVCVGCGWGGGSGGRENWKIGRDEEKKKITSVLPFKCAVLISLLSTPSRSSVTSERFTAGTQSGDRSCLTLTPSRFHDHFSSKRHHRGRLDRGMQVKSHAIAGQEATRTSN